MKLKFYKQLVVEVNDKGEFSGLDNAITLANLIGMEEGNRNFYLDTPENRKFCTEICELDKHITVLQTKQNLLYRNLKVIEGWIETGEKE